MSIYASADIDFKPPTPLPPKILDQSFDYPGDDDEGDEVEEIDYEEMEDESIENKKKEKVD